ncbi:hypothetical protein F5Y18DRAFT_434743 [Xylariaceae sp. FL1019]|nr:hypothetical protein F5Y18DRAFT_434743 [Xylariaceae sp. FL1019]
MAPSRVNNLIDNAPKRGMIYADKFRITSRDKRDHAIRRALRTVGLKATDRDGIDRAFASVFVEAIDEEDHLVLFKFADALKPRLRWTQELSDADFYEFIVKVVDARRAYKASPRPPFDISQHSETARAIDELLAAVGTSWDTINTDLTLFELVGGNDDDDAEDDGSTKMDLSSLQTSLDEAVRENRAKEEEESMMEVDVERDVDAMEID